MAAGRLYEFGEFRLDPAERLLFRSGTHVPLPPKAADILVLLVERRGHLVDKDTLLKEIWPDTFVEEGSLTQNVSVLRKILTEGRDGKELIETIPRRGYRFIASVKEVPEAIASPGSARDVPPATQPATLPSRRFVIGALAALVLALVVALGVFLRSSRPVSHPRPSRTFVPAPEGTSFLMTGDLGGAVILSPDGSALAFVASAPEGGSMIWLRSLDSLSSQPLRGTEGASFPFWSPDGRSIGFFADGKLKRVDLPGEAPVILADAPTNRGGSWSRRGIIVFAPGYQTGLFQVPADGGAATPVTSLRDLAQTSHRFPHFLPDGAHFVYLGANNAASSGEQTELYFDSLDGKARRRLTRSDSGAVYASGYLLFMRGSTLFAQRFDPDQGLLKGEPIPTVERVAYDAATWKGVFAASETGTLAYQLSGKFSGTEMVWVERSGRPLGLLGPELDQFNLRISPDGKRLAVTAEGNPTTDIWVYDLSAAASHQRFTFDAADHDDPVW